MRSNIWVYISAVIASIFATSWILWAYPVISPDAAVYLQTALLYQHLGLHQASQAFSWPFYSILIAKLQGLSSLSLLHSAQTLTFVCTAFTFCALPALIGRLGGQRRELYLGILFLLAYHHYLLSLHTLIRDFAYWAASLWALYFLLRFWQQPRFWSIFAWSILAIIASLFRIEGCLFLCLLPFLIFVHTQMSWLRRCAYFLSANWLTLASIALAIWHRQYHLLWQQTFAGHTLLQHSFVSKAAIIQPLIFPSLAVTQVAALLTLGSICLLIFTFLTTFSLPYLLLLGYGIYQKILFKTAGSRCVFSAYIILNIAVIIASFLRNGVFEGRYQLCLCLLLLPLLARPFSHLYDQWKTRQTLFFPLIVLLLLIGFGASLLHQGPSKAYLVRSAKWLNTLPTDTRVYTNSSKLPFYIQAKTNGWHCSSLLKPLPPHQALCFSWAKIPQHPWQGFDYLVLEVSGQDEQDLKVLAKLLGRQPDKIFWGNRHHDRIIIYQLPK